MRVMVVRNWFTYMDKKVETYSGSIVRVLREKGHEVVEQPKGTAPNYDGIDLVLDLDCGRNLKGELHWAAQDARLPVPSAVMFIDSHGYPAMHRRLAKHYDHVFFAVWDKRDLFAKHPSAHWSPNFTDLKWFDGANYMEHDGGMRYHFGFFGSKGGLSRADPLKEVAEKHGWRADVRQICPGGKHAWPSTAKAMSNCDVLFNHSQKHDGPNLRVMESMLMNRPLISDMDQRSGMSLLFTEGVHYIGYEAYTYSGLEGAMLWAADHPEEAQFIASRAYQEVKEKHLVGNRVDQVMEAVNNG